MLDGACFCEILQNMQLLSKVILFFSLRNVLFCWVEVCNQFICFGSSYFFHLVEV